MKNLGWHQTGGSGGPAAIELVPHRENGHTPSSFPRRRESILTFHAARTATH